MMKFLLSKKLPRRKLEENIVSASSECHWREEKVSFRINNINNIYLFILQINDGSHTPTFQFTSALKYAYLMAYYE